MTLRSSALLFVVAGTSSGQFGSLCEGRLGVFASGMELQSVIVIGAFLLCWRQTGKLP